MGVLAALALFTVAVMPDDTSYPRRDIISRTWGHARMIIVGASGSSRRARDDVRGARAGFVFSPAAAFALVDGDAVAAAAAVVLLPLLMPLLSAEMGPLLASRFLGAWRILSTRA